MRDAAALRARIVGALVAEGSAPRAQCVTLVVDFLLDRPVRELVDVDAVADIVAAGLARDVAARLMERHVVPAIERHDRRVRESGETLGDHLPDDVRARLVTLLAGADGPRAAWARGAVDPALVRRLLAPVLQEVLLGFARKLPGLGGDGGSGEAHDDAGRGGGGAGALLGGVAGRLKRGVERRAERLVDVGRTVLGGLGAELERQVQTAARDFSQGAVAGLRDAVRARLKSPEGRETMAALRRQVLERLLATPLHDLHDDLARLPLRELAALVPDVAQHDATRAGVRAALREEVAAAVAVYAGDTARAWFAEAGLAETVRASLCARGDTLAAGLFGGDRFAAWLDALLEG
jgi:hypothetical protein